MLVQQKQNIKGFTLLELLVVVAIVGIISAVGYPRLDTWISKNRVIAEAEKIHSLISLVTSQVERGYYPYAMIQFETGSPTVIKAQGVTQTTFNKRIKKPGAPAIACEKSDFTGWLDGGTKEWQEISTHTMHEDTFLDKLSQASQSKEKTICKICNEQEITVRNFHMGHIISKHHGGSYDLTNLYPICPACNRDMSETDMDIYLDEKNIAKFELLF